MRKRFIRTGVTLLVLLGAIGVAGYVGLQYVTAPFPGLRTASNCQTKTVQATLRARDVQVSVFNDGDRAGLAKETLAKLAKRGFRKGVAANTSSPHSQGVKAVQVRSTQPDSQEARLVAAQFGVEPQFNSPTDLGPGIDVVVGNKFKGLVKKAQTQLTYTKTEQVCSAS